MADNYYYVEDLVSVGTTRILTDDGTGLDWLIFRSSHDSNAISLSWWSVNGIRTEGQSVFFDGDDVFSRLIVRGLIENARGADGDDWIRGNEASNILYGDTTASNSMGGEDTLDGAEGNDTIYAGFGRDEVEGGTGNDMLYGNAGNDTIAGGLGRDTVDGGTGADALSGGGDAGDLLTYAESSAAVRLSLTVGATTIGSGGDAAGDQVNGFLNLTGSAYGDALTDTISTTLQLNANANLFDGGIGNDTLTMGGGNDTALGGAGNDSIDGGEGNDSLNAGTGDDMVLGGEGNDSVNAGIGRDVVFGGSGNDTVIGGLGTDQLSGGAGDDRIDGGDGSDTLSGDAGNDVLISFLGTDRMTGGAGADRFVFVNVYDSSAGAGFDTITDFKHSEGDRIDLSGIDANYTAAGDAAFRFLGAAAFTGAGAELRISATATGWRVLGDLDGDRTADFILTLTGTAMPALMAGDFLL